MSTAAFVQVSKRLKALLQKALNDDGNISPKPQVVLLDPAQEPSGQETTRVSLWLYYVAVDEFSRNAATAAADDLTATRRRFKVPPLGVNLFYLVTPILGNPEAEQQALARVMLTLHENALLSVTQGDAEVNEHVRISLLTESLDDRIKLWESLGKPHRLGVGYQVRTVRLVSKQTEEVAPVVMTTTGLEEKPGPVPVD